MNKKNVISAMDLEIAARLRSIWKRKKKELSLTQEKAAGVLGFSTQGAVSQYLNGKVPLNVENALKFSAMLEVDPVEINPQLEGLLRHVRNGSPAVMEVDRKLTPEQQELLDIFATLPDKESQRFLAEMKARKAHFMAMYEEMHKKIHGKAS